MVNLLLGGDAEALSFKCLEDGVLDSALYFNLLPSV
jgi:hypothetical protein